MRRSTLTLTSTAFILGSSILAICISACGSSDPPPPTTPSAQPYPQQGAYPQQQPGYPPPQQQPGYPPPQQQPYPQQPGYPQPSAAPPVSAQMATPGPLALPCSNDGSCGLHRCNVPAGKCAFPCQTPVDCAAGNQCLMGVCAPKAPGSP